MMRNFVNNLRLIKPTHVHAEDVLIWGLMAISFFIMFSKLNHIIEYTFVGLLTLWGYVKVKNKDNTFVQTPLDIPLVLFVTWVLFTIPFAVDPSYSFTEWRKTLLQILMFYFVVNVVTSEKQVRKILLAFLMGVVLLSVVGIVEHIAKGETFFDKSSQAGSLTSAGQWFSSYLVMGIPFVWLFLAESEGRRAKLFVCGVWVIIILALFLSHTRGAWLAFFAQLSVLGLMRARNKPMMWTIIAFICGLILFGGYLFKENQKRIDQNIHHHLASYGSLNLRLSIWQTGFEQIMAKPIIGYGYGNHTFQKINENGSDASGNDLTEMHLHNVFLSMVYELGLTGFALFALIYFRIVKSATQGVRLFGETFLGELGVCVILLVVGVVTRNMFDNMLVGTLSYLFWLLIGLYFAHRLHSRSKRVQNAY